MSRVISPFFEATVKNLVPLKVRTPGAATDSLVSGLPPAGLGDLAIGQTVVCAYFGRRIMVLARVA